MKLKRIERQFTITADFYFSLYALIPTILLAGVLAKEGSRGRVYILTCLAAVLAVFFGLLARHIRTALLLRNHTKSLLVVSTQNQWQLQMLEQTPISMPEDFSRMSLALLSPQGYRTHNYVTTERWEYIDWSYAKYEHTRGGEYKAADVYYSAMAAPLPRILPNVFFDSKSRGARGRRFKAQFRKDQRHDLEGDFNDYFDTYFAEGYTVDSLSFITPEVMELLQAARDYDIEIVGDRLLMYGPIYVDATSLTDMAAKLLAIQAKLADNAVSYRDDRLPADEAAQTVTPEGMELQHKQYKWYLGLIVVALYYILQAVLAHH